MLVLLFHKMTFNKLSALHLEGQNFGHLIDPGCLGSLVSLTVFIILVIRDLTTEHVLPCLVEIIFVLDVQDDVVLNLCMSLHYRKVLFVDKLN